MNNNKIYRIMFVCHGNICRSPMAEFVFKNIAKNNGAENNFIVRSCATSDEEIGNPVYPPAKAELAKHGISCDGKFAVRLLSSDYDKYDLFVCMDGNNVRNASRIFGGDEKGKIVTLLSFTGFDRDVADPWYFGQFDKTYADILAGCSALFDYLTEKQQ